MANVWPKSRGWQRERSQIQTLRHQCFWQRPQGRPHHHRRPWWLQTQHHLRASLWRLGHRYGRASQGLPRIALSCALIVLSQEFRLCVPSALLPFSCCYLGFIDGRICHIICLRLAPFDQGLLNTRIAKGQNLCGIKGGILCPCNPDCQSANRDARGHLHD